MQSTRKRVRTDDVVGLNTGFLQPEDISAIESFDAIVTEVRDLDEKLRDKLSVLTSFIGE